MAVPGCGNRVNGTAVSDPLALLNMARSGLAGSALYGMMKRAALARAKWQFQRD
jgi:hypothetical protein